MALVDDRDIASRTRFDFTLRAPQHLPTKPWGKRYARKLLITDLLSLIWAASGLHLVGVGTSGPAAKMQLPGLALTLAMAFAWAAALAVSGSRDPRVTGFGADEYKRVIRATFAVAGLTAIVSYLFQLELPRSYLLVMVPAGLFALIATRYVWRRWLHLRRDYGHMASRVVAVGCEPAVRELLQELARAPRAGYRVVGACLDRAPGEVRSEHIDGVPVVGSLDDVADVAKALSADAVAVTSSEAFGPARVRKLSWDLESSGTDLILAPALTNVAGPRVHTKPVAGLPLIHVESPTYRGATKFVKKTFDLCGSVALVALLAPLLISLMIAVKFSSPGPVFFVQRRVGLNGRDFKMIKFRSMVVDAEARLDSLRASHQDAGNVTLFKMKEDPRITKVGRFIRRYSLDELPQLFNVVKGDMSLVGPRPPLLSEVEKYGDDARLRLLVKPGMTGLWQVSGRSDLSWDETVRLDVYYVENWSITSDLVILWKTAKAVVGSSGAY